MQASLPKGVVRSKISRGYVEIDGLGGTLLFTRTKSDKNWPRYGASYATRSKNDFCPTLAELKSPAKLASSNSNVSTNRIMLCASDAECQTATLVHACQTLVTVIQKRRLHLFTHFH